MKKNGVRMGFISAGLALGIGIQTVDAKDVILPSNMQFQHTMDLFSTVESSLRAKIEMDLNTLAQKRNKEEFTAFSNRLYSFINFCKDDTETEYELLLKVDALITTELTRKIEEPSFEDDITVCLTKVYSNELVAKTDMKDYVMGSLYIECGDPKDTSLTEYYKAMAIMIKTFGLRRGGYRLDGDTSMIQLRNGNADQGYCPIDQGCHVKFDSPDATIPTIIPGVGEDDPNHYSHGKPALKDAFARDELSRYYDETKGYVLVNDDQELSGGNYDNDLQIKMQEMAYNGASYQDILAYACPGKQLYQVPVKEQFYSENTQFGQEVSEKVLEKIR